MAFSDAAQCTAKSKHSGTRCKNPAVTGFTVCRLHGAGNRNKGKQGGRPISTGIYSVKHRHTLSEKLGEYLDLPNPESLASELALLRALLQDLLDKIPDGGDMTPELHSGTLTLIDAIGRTVERDARVRNANALTGAEIALLLAALKAGTEKYIDDPAKRAAFIDEIRAALGIARSVGSERYQLTE